MRIDDRTTRGSHIAAVVVVALLLATAVLALQVGQWGRTSIDGTVADLVGGGVRFTLRPAGSYGRLWVRAPPFLPDTVFTGNRCRVEGTGLGLLVLADRVSCKSP